MTSTTAPGIPEGRVEPPAAIARGLRLFSSPPGAPRYRRATDILLLVPALLGLVLVVAAYPPGRSERALAGWLDSIPAWLDPADSFFYDLLALSAIVIVATTLLARRWLVFLQALASLVLALIVAFLAARAALGGWPNLLDAAAGGSRSPRFPGVRLAEASAVVLAVSPHLVRPLQRFSRWVLALGLAGALTVDVAPPSGYVAGLLAAIVAAAGIRLALGTSAGLPGLADVAAALAELRFPVDGLALAERGLAGVVVLGGRDADGRPVVVKVYGRDAYDNQLVEKFWRTLWYRDCGPGLAAQPQSGRRARGVRDAARRVPACRRIGRPAGTTTGDDVLLVLRGDARAARCAFAFRGRPGAGRTRLACARSARTDERRPPAHRPKDARR